MRNWHLFLIPLFYQIFITISQANHLDSISFFQAREIILQQNSGIKSALLEIDAAQTVISQAGVFPNPEVNIALDKFGVNEIEASVEQAIELGGKRKLRTDIAHKKFDAVKSSVETAKNDLESEIVRRFVPIAILREKLTLLDSLIDAATIAKEQIDIRINAGAAKKTDLIRAEIELERFALDRSEMIRQLDQAQKKFAVLGGEENDQFMYVKGSIDTSAPIPSIKSLQQALLSSPQIASFDIERSLLSFEQKQHRAEAIPDLNISAGVLGSGTEKRFSPLIGFSMDIPLFDRNSAAQKQTIFQQQAVFLRKENTFKQIIAEIEDLHSRLIEIDRRINVLTSSTIPKSESVYSMLQEYYNAGKVSFLDLTAIRTEMLDLQLSHLDLIAERALTIADLIQKTSLRVTIVK